MTPAFTAEGKAGVKERYQEKNCKVRYESDVVLYTIEE
jgi:hypothetical protein